jgi:hypothetical protein
MNAKIHIPGKKLKEFCRQNRIRRLSLFGSVLRDDFTPQSDVDMLVEFETDARVGLITLAGMEIELTGIVGRKVELHTVAGLHPYFRRDVFTLAKVAYEQA